MYLQINPACPSPFVQGINRLYLPVRHGEGKFLTRDDDVLCALRTNHQIAARYIGPDGDAAPYPWNPNGSVDDVAAVCDPSGRVFGLMPHPEAYTHRPTIPAGRANRCRKRGRGWRSSATPSPLPVPTCDAPQPSGRK